MAMILMLKYALRMNSFSFVCYILENIHELDNYLASVVVWGSLNFIHIMSRGHCYYHLGNSLKRASYGQFSCDVVHSSYKINVCFWIYPTKLTLKGCSSLYWQ